MKKILALILLTGVVLSFAACGGTTSTETEGTTTAATTESNTPAITLQEVYEAGKNLSALLGDHESVYIRVVSNGNVLQEEYVTKESRYSFLSEDYMDMGFAYVDFTTDHSQYIYSDNLYAFNVTVTPDGMIDMEENFATLTGVNSWISSELLNDKAPSIVVKDGSIIVTCTADPDEIFIMGDDIVSCVETYTLDAATREMTSVKTVYTFEDGTVEEGVATITRDVEVPDGMKPFLAYEQDTENFRTVTVVSNPGTENEKTEIVRAPKGLAVCFSADWTVEETCTMYTDAACTQPLEEEPDVNADFTVYIQWEPMQEQQ